jgi:hypothetical protein
MTTEQTVIFDRFLSEVAPKLVGTGVVLTAEEVALAIAGLDLSVGIKAELEHISIVEARLIVFTPLYACFDAATFEEFLAALELVRSAPVAQEGNTLTRGLEAIGIILANSGRLIWKGLSLSFAKVQSALRTACGWTAAKACTVAAYLQTNTFPWIAVSSKAVWNWTSSSVVAVSKTVWSGIRIAASYAWAAMSFVCNSVVNVLVAVGSKLGDWAAPKTLVQRVAISKPCNISLPYVVTVALAGITYITVTLAAGKGQMALLRSEIAGCGVLCN